MRGQDARDLVVAAGEPARLVEVPEPDAAGHRRVVDVGDVVGVVDLVEQLEAPLLHRPAEVVLAAHPERDRACIPGVRAQVRIAEPLRERARFARLPRLSRAEPSRSARSAPARGPATPGRRARGPGRSSRRRARGPAGGATSRPGAPTRTTSSAYSSAAVARSGASSIALFIAARNGSPSCLSAFARPIAAPEAQLRARLGPQLERAVQHRERVLELVPADRELGSPAEPVDGLRAQPLQLGVVARPGQVGVLGPCGLGVVVCEQSRVLVAAVARPAPARRRTRRGGGRGAASGRPRRRPRASARAGT